ncbi:hypothetical protein DB42_EA00740 [Neochlamydia sp. EPS4]|uniref:type III secretion system chaperone n=1 Tax=Neochlamydia sp. EPS4 TaxID=1478175 RepID=UPI0005828A3C|nr:type III secretion system chaperone [Neochlamydia sp. EPS4]KIC76202.1 hypothetical protein DB42_EA00740 [Neochlamydia sp. EPS4]
MELEDLLLEYGRSKQLGRLQLDSSGLCTLLMNGHYLLTFEKSHDQEGFYLYSSVGDLPLEKEGEVILMALKGNLFGRETGRASLGYVEQTRSLVLFEYFDKNELNYLQFIQRFNQFVKYLFYWITKLKASASPDMDKKAAVEPRPTFHHSKKIFYA